MFSNNLVERFKLWRGAVLSRFVWFTIWPSTIRRRQTPSPISSFASFVPWRLNQRWAWPSNDVRLAPLMPG